MLRILETFYAKMSPAPETEGFNQSYFPLLVALLTVVILQLLLGKYLWNNFLVRLIPAIQPAKGVVDILAIALLVHLIVC
jgi:hypothetical protein